MTDKQHIFEGILPPDQVPLVPFELAQHFTDTNTGKTYLSVGTSSANDWQEVGSGGGGASSAIIDPAFSSYFEIDASVTTSPIFVFDSTKPFVKIKLIDGTGVNVTIKVPDNENPLSIGDLGGMKWECIFDVSGNGTFNSITWENQASADITMYGTSLDSMTSHFNYFNVGPINGSGEWAISKVSEESYW